MLKEKNIKTREKAIDLIGSSFIYETPEELLTSLDMQAPAITPTVTVTAFSVEGVLFTVGFAAGGVTVSVAAGC